MQLTYVLIEQKGRTRLIYLFSCPVTSELMFVELASIVLGATDTIGLWTWTEATISSFWLSRWWIIGLCTVLCEPSLTKMSEPVFSKIFFEVPWWSVVRIQHFHCHGLDLIPGQGTKILRAMWHPSCRIFSLLTHTHIYSSFWFLFSHTHTHTHLILLVPFFLEHPDSHHAEPSAARLGGRWLHGGMKVLNQSPGRGCSTPVKKWWAELGLGGALWASDSGPPWVVDPVPVPGCVVSVIPNIVLAAALSDVLLLILFCWLHTNIGAVHRSCNSGATESWESVDGLQTVRSSSDVSIRIMWSVHCRSSMLPKPRQEAR